MGYAGAELNIFAQIKAIRDVVSVALDLGLTGVAFAPVPLLLKLFGEGIGVFDTLDIDSRARIPVPVPGAADSLSDLEALHAQPAFSSAMDHVEPGEAGAHNHHVDLFYI